MDKGRGRGQACQFQQLWLINNQNTFLRIWRLEVQEQGPAQWASGKSLSRAVDSTLLLSLHVTESKLARSPVSPDRGTNPIMEAPPS